MKFWKDLPCDERERLTALVGPITLFAVHKDGSNVFEGARLGAAETRYVFAKVELGFDAPPTARRLSFSMDCIASDWSSSNMSSHLEIAEDWSEAWF